MSQLDPDDPIVQPESTRPAPEPETSSLAIAWREQRDSQTRAFDRWIIALVVIAVAACCLLISASKGSKEGMRPWAPNSVLHGLVELLNFNSAYPTYRGVCVKYLAQNLSAAAAVLGAGIIWYLRSRRDDEVLPSESAGLVAHLGSSRFCWDVQQIIPATASQIALLFFAAWAMLSCRWAHFSQGAFNEGLRVMMIVIWAVAIGRTITRRGAVRAATGVVGVLLVTAIIGLWYYYERNPFMRLEFPIGGPIFFAACMLPAIVLSLVGLAWFVEHMLKSQASTDASQDFPSTTAGRRPAWIPWMIGIGAVFVLGIVSWAFVLTRSRSPQVALVVALAIGFVLVLIRHVSVRYRRVFALGVVAAALLGVLFVGMPWWQSQLHNQLGGRGASVRLRLKTWRYAGELFAARPLTGHGQGGYILLSQQLACMPRDAFGRSDIEMDPTAFTAEMIGHAHNEFLEILADLGAVGFAAIVTALGMTLWAGMRAYVTATQPAEKWCLLGLIVSLVAIIIEECADVALRMAGLPIIFYTIIGLIWAMSLPPHEVRSTGPRLWPTRWLPEKLRPVGLFAVILVAVVMMSAAQRDWRGAIADGKVEEVASQGRWEEAMVLADAGRQNRMVLEDELSARLHLTWSSLNATQYCMQQIVGTLSRQKPPINAARVKKIIDPDLERFDQYLRTCLGSGQECWAIMPYIRSVSEWMAQGLLFKARLESIKQQIGIQPDNKPFLAAARDLMLREYHRDRLNMVIALRLYDLNPESPIEVRVELLRVPLRCGPEASLRVSVESRIAQLVAREPVSLNHQLEVLAQAAEGTASQPSDGAATQPASEGQPDPYAPETYRIQAMAARYSGKPGQAIAFVDKAVRLYEAPAMRLYYPTALSYALLERARYLLLSDAANARQAVAVCRRAIDEWPMDGDREQQLQPLRRELSLYLLAAGDEGAASDLIRQQVSDGDSASVERNIGYGFAELCGMFLDCSPNTRPADFKKWLSRSLERATDDPRVRWIAAQAAMQDGDGAEAVKHLKVMEEQLDDPRQMASMVGVLAQRYPDNPDLKGYITAHLSSTRPANPESNPPNPASQPAAKQRSVESAGVLQPTIDRSR